MTASSNDQGRAYEYAWMRTLFNAIKDQRNIKADIIENSSYRANERAWNKIDDDLRSVFLISANAAIDTLLELEPILTENEDTLNLEFQSDNKGVDGDVRDIVISKSDDKWGIGLSIKHNHNAVKHSRLSRNLDFGEKWYGIKCSQEYWDDVEPIFDNLSELQKYGKKFSDLDNKVKDVYLPLLNAFMDEINRKVEEDSNVPKRIVEYLLGSNDYYKIISKDSKKLTLIQTFNMHNTLNKRSKIKVSAITVPKLELPNELVEIKLKKNSKTTVEMYFNNGWQLSFRLHSASSKIEPSLKFDIKFIGVPVDILSIECHWHKK